MPDYNAGNEAKAVTDFISLDLISEGVRFDRAYSLPTCSPTRASILLGQYPFRHGIGRQVSQGGIPLIGQENDDDEESLAELLRASSAAYQTIAVGKWHLSRFGTQFQNDLSAPHNLGFDRFAGTMFAVGGSYCNPIDSTNWMTEIYDGTGVSQTPATPGAYLIEEQVDYALAYFSELQPSKPNDPIFLWAALQAPFGLHQRPDTNKYSDTNLNITITDPCSFAAGGEEVKCFDAMIQVADQEIERLLEGIGTMTGGNWYDTTTVFIVGDNGSPETVERFPFVEGKMKESLFEGGVRVPLYIAGRAVNGNEGDIEFDPVHAIDIFQTVLDVAGVTTQPIEPIDSLSLLSYLDGSNPAPVRDWLYTERFEQNKQNGLPHVNGERRVAWRSDIDGDFKAFYTPGTPPPGVVFQAPVLRELTVDLWEVNPPVIPGPVGGNPIYGQKLAELKQLIDDLLPDPQ